MLQISTDERARVARVAERFSEEDLSRFMQIMLRTHSELGYKQEQRFHLELGLLKLVHAQRLLPLEELLSGEVAQAKAGSSAPAARSAASSSRAPSPAGRVGVASRANEAEVASSRGAAASPFARPSPFEADRQRKSEPKAETPGVVAQTSPVVKAAVGAATDADGSSLQSAVEGGSVATAVAMDPEPVAETSGEISCDEMRNAVLTALEDAGQHVLAHNLEEGEWSVRGGEVAVKVGMSQVLIDVALGPEPKRIMQAALSKAVNRPLKFKMVSGTPAVAARTEQPPRPANGAGARSRAMADPYRAADAGKIWRRDSHGYRSERTRVRANSPRKHRSSGSLLPFTGDFRH